MYSKYTIIKGKTGKSKKVVVEGFKKVLYKKDGNRKMYVVSKGKMMQLTKYKEMKKKQKSKNAKKSVKSKLNKKKRSWGGSFEYYESNTNGLGPMFGKDWRVGNKYKTDKGSVFTTDAAKSYDEVKSLIDHNGNLRQFNKTKYFDYLKDE